MPFHIPQDSLDFIIKLIVSALLGGLTGLERDIHGRAAGLRFIHSGIDRNIEEGFPVLWFFIHIHQKGITDKLSHRFIGTLEKTGIPLKYLKWEH